MFIPLDFCNFNLFTLFDFDFLNPLFCFPSFCIVLCCTCHFLWLFPAFFYVLCDIFVADKAYLPLCHLFCKVLNFQSAGWLLFRVEGGTYTCLPGSFLTKVFNLKYHRLHLRSLMVLWALKGYLRCYSHIHRLCTHGNDTHTHTPKDFNTSYLTVCGSRAVT